MKEEYRQHPYLAVIVSNLGNVKTLNGKQKNLQQEVYLRTTCKNLNTGKWNKLSVHRLVAETFIGLIPVNHVVNHINGNKVDNKVSNLEIVTYLENNVHAIKTGLRKISRGEEMGANCNHSEKEIVEICNLIKQGNSNVYIGKLYNMTEKNVHSIRVGHRWKYLFKDHLGKIYKSPGINNVSINDYFKVIDYIKENPNLKNKDIGNQLNIESSMISRIKNRKCWKIVYEYYDNRATTIETASDNDGKE